MPRLGGIMKLDRVLDKERTRIQTLLDEFNDRLAKINKAAIILNGTSHKHHKYRMSVAARKKISKAQKAWWAKRWALNDGHFLSLVCGRKPSFLGVAD